MRNLYISSQPDNNVLYSKNVRKGKTRFHDVIWKVTKEVNCLIVWRGQCNDREHPWEESDWTWEVKQVLLHKNEAIEACVLSALNEAKQEPAE